MPHLAPGLVRRNDLRGSARLDLPAPLVPDRLGRVRPHRHAARLEKSVTKQLVAMQPGPDHCEPSLFQDLLDRRRAARRSLPEDAPAGIALPAAQPGPARPARLAAQAAAFVVAHTLDADTGEIELTFGLPWLNLRGGSAWHWRENLLTVPLPAVRRTEIPTTAKIDKLSAVPDAQVRLRVIDGGRRAGRERDGGHA